MIPAERIHLLYGNEEVKLEDARYELVCSILPAEERAGGVVELRPAGTQPYRLERAFTEITSELAQTTLLGDMPRVVVIRNLADLYGSSGSKAKAGAKKGKEPEKDHVAALEEFLDGTFRDVPNVAVFVCEEDEDKNRAVDDRSPLFQMLARRARLRAFREKPIARTLEEELYNGRLERAVEVMNEWKERAGNESAARLKMYRTVSGFAEMVVQAKAAQLARENDWPRDDLLHGAAYPSFAKLPDFRRAQASRFAARTGLAELRRLVAELHRVQTLMYPKGTEAYVADWFEALERALLRLTISLRAA
ncbi:MAG: hypothetical protein SF028_06380 [Candidatus Sumerlaeia bacterium]|nr:hypothetical protein [Candidatus Sumerlaeia bacterium]